MLRLLQLLVALVALTSRQEVDPALKSAVERFYATQEAEDLEGYLALWSRSAERPKPEQLRFIFESGADKFIDLEIWRTVIAGSTARVRVVVTRLRTASNSPGPDGAPRVFKTRLPHALAYVLEDGDWKLVREGAPADELALALISERDTAARAALMKADADLVDLVLVNALSRRADVLAQTRQYRAAIGIYERSLEVTRAMTDARAEGQTLQNIGNCHYFLRDFPAALGAYDKRLAIARQIADDEGAASALVGIATIRYSTYEYAAALALYQEALAIQERLGEEALAATTLISTGNVLYIQGDYEAAIADYRRAEGLKRKHFDTGGAATALEGVGRAEAARGDLAAALVAFTGVLDEGRTRKDPQRQGSALQNLGDVHFRLGNLDAARSAYDESRLHFEKAGDLANAGRVWQGTGVTELMSVRLAQAEAAYRKSSAACSAAQPQTDAECVARALVGLAFAQSAQEHYDEAITSYRKSIDAFTGLKAGEAVGRARVGLAEALSGKEEYAAAIVEATSARHAALALDVDDLFWRAQVSVARAERKLGRKSAALATARTAVSAVHRMASAALDRPGQAVPRDTAAAFATTAILQAEAGDPASAWLTAEQMRAHTLRSVLAPNERDIAKGMTDQEREDERRAAAGLNGLYAQRDREKSLPKPDRARLDRLDTAVAAAIAKRKTWQERLFRRLPELGGWRGLAAPASLEEIQGVAQSKGTLILQLVVDDHDLLVLTAAPGAEAVALSADVVPVRRQAVAESVARAIDPRALADDEAWRRAVANLVKLLPAHVVSQLASATRIIVIPDDMLWRLPFEALPLENAYLADRATVTYSPSITTMVRAPQSAGPQQPFQVLVASAPEIPRSVVDTLALTAPSWTLRPADSAEQEAARIATALPEDSNVLLKAAATEEGVRASAAAASTIHIGAPFRVNAASPLFSSVLLSRAARDGEPQPSQNGVLEAREVPTAGLAARSVVFSDPAALSMRDAAAAMPAFHWALRAGGIDTLIVRRWPGNDAAASDLLAAFYERLRSNVPPVEALSQARADARKGGAAPQVWAGWLLLIAR